MDAFHSPAPFPSFNEFFRHTGVQGTRAVQGHQRNQVPHGFRAQPFHQPGHPRAFQLEHPLGIPGAQHFAHRFVFQRDGIQINPFPCAFFYKMNRIVHYRQGTEPQKVHL